jgi:hypothetical protein
MPRYKKSKPKTQQRQLLRNFAQRLTQGEFKDKQIVLAQSGEVKMSEVLQAFIAPYVYIATTTEAYRKLVMTAIVAWNTALMQSDQRSALIENMLNKLPQLTAKDKNDFRGIVNDFIQR